MAAFAYFIVGIWLQNMFKSLFSTWRDFPHAAEPFLNCLRALSLNSLKEDKELFLFRAENSA